MNLLSISLPVEITIKPVYRDAFLIELRKSYLKHLKYSLASLHSQNELEKQKLIEIQKYLRETYNSDIQLKDFLLFIGKYLTIDKTFKHIIIINNELYHNIPIFTILNTIKYGNLEVLSTKFLDIILNNAYLEVKHLKFLIS